MIKKFLLHLSMSSLLILQAVAQTRTVNDLIPHLEEFEIEGDILPEYSQIANNGDCSLNGNTGFSNVLIKKALQVKKSLALFLSIFPSDLDHQFIKKTISLNFDDFANNYKRKNSHGEAFFIETDSLMKLQKMVLEKLQQDNFEVTHLYLACHGDFLSLIDKENTEFPSFKMSFGDYYFIGHVNSLPNYDHGLYIPNNSDNFNYFGFGLSDTLPDMAGANSPLAVIERNQKRPLYLKNYENMNFFNELSQFMSAKTQIFVNSCSLVSAKSSVQNSSNLHKSLRNENQKKRMLALAKALHLPNGRITAFAEDHTNKVQSRTDDENKTLFRDDILQHQELKLFRPQYHRIFWQQSDAAHAFAVASMHLMTLALFLENFSSMTDQGNLRPLFKAIIIFLLFKAVEFGFNKYLTSPIEANTAKYLKKIKNKRLQAVLFDVREGQIINSQKNEC